MSRTGSLYIEKESIFHDLDGSIKFIMLIAWTSFIFMFMDARIFSFMILVGFGMLKIAQIKYKNIRPLLLFVIAFTIFNSIFLIIITPEYGSKLAASSTKLISLYGNHSLTLETLFFALTLSLKYLAILPITLLFVLTTHPSRFASSLNRIGVSYKIAYAVSIALRYIPDVKDEMETIIQAQEARGIPFRKGDASIVTRVKNYGTILLPLLTSSLNRIEIVSNAMDLRGFGRYKKRTWYNQKNINKIDILFLILCIAGVVIGFLIRNNVFSGFWYPFGI